MSEPYYCGPPGYEKDEALSMESERIGDTIRTQFTMRTSERLHAARIDALVEKMQEGKLVFLTDSGTVIGFISV